MKVKGKDKLNNPLKGWQIVSAISLMVFHTEHWYHSFLVYLTLNVVEFLFAAKTIHRTIPVPSVPVYSVLVRSRRRTEPTNINHKYLQLHKYMERIFSYFFYH